MDRTVTLRREGGSLAIPLPDDIAELMNVDEGDKLYLVRTDRGFALVPDAPGLTEDDRAVLAAFDEVVQQYDTTLRRLAQ
jgi:antitoxin component of MazEF toxin-antitoxin module